MFNTNARQYFTHDAFRKTSIETKFFFTTHGGYNFFLKKSRTRRLSRCVPKSFYKKLNCLYYPPWIQFLSKQMQDNTLLTVCTEKRLLKLSFFQYSQWIQNFSKKMQNDTLLTTCTKKLLIKLIGFTTHREYQNVQHKCKTILYSRCVPKDFD